MKKNIVSVFMFLLAGILFAENAVDYTRNWESRNTLIYEDGNVLWDIYVDEFPLTTGTVYRIEYCIEKKDYSEKKSTFENWYIHDEYDLYFDSYKKTDDFMNAITQVYLKDKSVLKTENFLEFVEKKFHYKFENNKYYDYEVKNKRYRINLISEDDYCVNINVYKTFYGACEDTEYSFVFCDYEKNIDYWIDDFDADLFFLEFTTFYESTESDLTLSDYFGSLPGKLEDAEGTSRIMTVDDYNLESLYIAFKNDFWYSIFTSITDFLEEETESDKPVSYMPVFF